MVLYDPNLVHTILWGCCNAKMIPTSTRKNAARCVNERTTKYGRRCKNHSTLPTGQYYACMFKKRAGPNRGKFCTKPLHPYHKFFCSAHATRENEQTILLQAFSNRRAAFEQFERNCGLPKDVTDVIFQKLCLADDVVGSLCQIHIREQQTGAQPPLARRPVSLTINRA